MTILRLNTTSVPDKISIILFFLSMSIGERKITIAGNIGAIINQLETINVKSSINYIHF
ncbi:MAG: hypothetical protein ACFFBP_11915 [Promethearchaeota archaeon]